MAQAKKTSTDVNYGDLADRTMKLFELYVPIAIQMGKDRHELRMEVGRLDLKLKEAEFNNSVADQAIERRSKVARADTDEVRLQREKVTLEASQLDLEETKAERAAERAHAKR